MLDKKQILEAWIMLEHLSEGDISLKDKKNLKFDELVGDDYYNFFQHKVIEKKIDQKKNGGFVVYCNIFEFEDVIQLLREMRDIDIADEDITYGKKYVFALYFDKQFNVYVEKTFYTVSGYIKNHGKMPYEKEFNEFEENFKQTLSQIFDIKELNADNFNAAFRRVLTRYNVNKENCRVEFIDNIETDATNLHSFFVGDLEKAKSLNSSILNKYLFGGKINERFNLDGKSDSINFNPDIFKDILHPKYYPLGRFPSKKEYALSFMQQVAVNLAISYDSENIRTVNGPPGTGKTTLLKDIFAELIVKQAYDIAIHDLKKIKGTDEMIYYDKAKIGKLPKTLTENSIVVTSSNNGAVQNIVNELPLIKDIGEDFKEQLIEADYFYALSNSDIITEWSEDQNGKKTCEITLELGEDYKNWGLFSLEGGKSYNMIRLLNYVNSAAEQLKDDYVSDDSIYKKFIDKYNELECIKNDAEKLAALQSDYDAVYHSLENLTSKYFASEKEKNNNLHRVSNQYIQACSEIAKERENLENHATEIADKLQEIEATLLEEKYIYEEKKQHKPSFFNFSAKKDYKRDLDVHIEKIAHIKAEKDELIKKKLSIQSSMSNNLAAKDALDKQMAKKQEEYDQWLESMKQKKRKLTDRIDTLSTKINQYKAVLLNMNLDYDSLQKSNPWFDEHFRVLQSELFIMALKVRKEFLYHNRKNITAAKNIWDNQHNYLNQKHLIQIAWHWINMVVPVISSTFASFSRMCQHLTEASMGHIFVDEAGQALPQSAVGAIFRSNHIMFVGDPFQIEPVLTLETTVLAELRERYKVGIKYLSENASAQTLGDAASKYGFYTETDKSDDSWIGIPLWVHRRCQYPMFSISNEISYHGLMVQGIDGKGKTAWYDIKGKATEKYVEEQFEFLKERILELREEGEDNIYVISPFRHVAVTLAKRLNEINFTKYEDNKPINVGTIHTFQGKEASIVFLVLGADNESRGAASWAVRKANMMNVAVTRAKREFYIIGDKALYKNLGSDVARDTIKIIDNYLKDNPNIKNSVYNFSIKQKEPDAFIYDPNATVETPSCPKCHQKMVLRSGIYGNFWGCSNFPNCRETISCFKN